MDRDMVNCLHYLYQSGSITAARLNKVDPKKKLFWCDPDTRYPLSSSKIVFEDIQTRSLKPADGVLELLVMIEQQLRSMPRPDYAFGYPFSNPIREHGETRPAFLAISYADSFKPVRKVVLAAAQSANFKCEVTEDLSNPGTITDQIWQGIRGADAVVADITGNNPNVFYEIGLAHSLGKEVIIISQENGAPFDIRASRKINYDVNNLRALKAQLIAAFGAVSARYPHEGAEPRF